VAQKRNGLTTNKRQKIKRHKKYKHQRRKWHVVGADKQQRKFDIGNNFVSSSDDVLLGLNLESFSRKFLK
jgi:hypothetical protein